MAKNSAPNSSFETMGQVAAPVNASAEPSANTKAVGKRALGGGMLEAATASHRQGILETLGAQGGIKAVMYSQNAAEASLVQRNVHLVPPTMGSRQFWDARANAQA